MTTASYDRSGRMNSFGFTDPLASYGLFKPSPNWAQQQLGEALGRALLVNEGWITRAQLRADVLKRCVGEQMCNNLQQMGGTQGPPYMVNATATGEGREIIRVGPYEIMNLDLLKAKLSQYPHETNFFLLQPSPSADSQHLEQQVQSAFEEAHLTLKHQ
jgi:hypothetical protein